MRAELIVAVVFVVFVRVVTHYYYPEANVTGHDNAGENFLLPENQTVKVEWRRILQARALLASLSL